MSETTESPHSAETERIRRIYEKEAPKFDRTMGRWDRILFAGNREWVCAQASGEVLEIAIGTGRNLSFYPDEIRLTGVELSPPMIEITRERAEELGREVDLRLGDAEALEFADESFDTVICTYSLCTIPDDRAAVREAKRVLRGGGKFVLAEHVRSPVGVVRGVEKLIEPLAVRFGGDHLTREPLEHLEAEGFTVDQVKRSKLGIVELVSAQKPAG
ncbi:MAG TPA: methyltransferase domain-containing protein [Solirubrobacterales bacterium]|nr:methyltransferase domain-containing protein [Solirubrobacterales bacterium]